VLAGWRGRGRRQDHGTDGFRHGLGGQVGGAAQPGQDRRHLLVGAAGRQGLVEVSGDLLGQLVGPLRWQGGQRPVQFFQVVADQGMVHGGAAHR